MRRSRGEGSVYKRMDGLWVARYGAAGKRVPLYGTTKKAVADGLRERLLRDLPERPDPPIE